jgi:hypothetical protein
VSLKPRAFLLLALGMAAPASALADPPKPVAEAWAKKDYSETERLARRAIEDGNMSPREVVDSYVYLGSSRAMQSKKAPAIAAFRAAGALDGDFLLPADAGPKAVDYANTARSDVASIGSISFTANIPKHIEPHTTFIIKATLDAAHLSLAKKMELHAKDGTSGKEHQEEATPGELTEYRVPMDLTLPGSVIKVRVDVLDRFRNRLASIEESIEVGGKAPEKAGAGGALAGKDAKKADKKKGGFWSSPWPYIVGGSLLLAAGGASAYYFFLRPPDVVTVGAPRVSTQ